MNEAKPAALSTDLYARLLDRRSLLQRLGLWTTAAGAWPLLKGCGDDDARIFLDATLPPNPNDSPINTLVVVMMENRSFDHYFASYSLSDTVNPRSDVRVVPADYEIPGPDGEVYTPFHLRKYCLLDPPHSWGSSHRQYNGGNNDMFAIENYNRWNLKEVAREVIGYHDRGDIPFLYDLADHFALCDHWFSSLLGPTQPNRYYLYAGQSGGYKANMESILSGLNFRTLFDLLDEAGIEWRSYYYDVPGTVLFRGVAERWNENLFPIDAYFGDAEAGRLPPVVFIEPGYVSNDDHPPHHIRLGQIFLSEVYHALAASPQWNESMFVVTYDEHGGFFDHVPPPEMDDDRGELGFNRLGFRVPAVVAGPYVRQGAAIDTVLEHSAVGKWICWRYGLEPLTARMRATGDLNTVLDLVRVNTRTPAPAPQFPPVSFPDDLGPHCDHGNEDLLIAEVAAKARRRNPHHHELEMAFDAPGGRLPKHLDMRHRADELMRMLLKRQAARAERLG